MPSKTRPLIGITSGINTNSAGSTLCQLGQAYVKAILHAGGMPLIIPTTEDTENLSSQIDQLDGLLLTGGGDIDPRRFRGKAHARIYGISPQRDQLEFALLGKALAADLPILAICRGIQVLNVFFDGVLFTDIQDQMPNALRHDWFPNIPRNYLAHTVKLAPESLINTIFNSDIIDVNSLHHQGIAAVGKGLKATAHAPDGLVEALEIPEAQFALGVQWHPECLPEDPGMQRLFKSFITACS